MLIELVAPSAPERDAQESYVPRELARERLEEYEAHAEQTRETHASELRGLEARFTEVQASSKAHFQEYIAQVRTAARERIEAQARELVTQRQAARQRLQEHRATAAETLRAAQAHWDAERSASEERAAWRSTSSSGAPRRARRPTRAASRTPSGDARYRRPRSRRQSRR